MKIPQTFLPENKNLEGKIKELLDDPFKKESLFEELELLKQGRTRTEKKDFLKLFAERIPDLIGKVRTKMELTKTNEIYLDEVPEEFKTRDENYRTRLEIRPDGHLYFLHSLSGMTFRADLDNKKLYSYNGYVIVYEYIDTYPDKENNYYSPFNEDSLSEDSLERYFKPGKEMYECIREFLAKK